MNRKALAPRQHTHSFFEASRAANLAASPRAEVFRIGRPSLVSSPPQLAGAGIGAGVGADVIWREACLHCGATWHCDGGSGVFRKAYNKVFRGRQS